MRSGAGFSEKFCLSHQSAIAMPVANHTPSWPFMYSVIALSALVLPNRLALTAHRRSIDILQSHIVRHMCAVGLAT